MCRQYLPSHDSRLLYIYCLVKAPRSIIVKRSEKRDHTRHCIYNSDKLLTRVITQFSHLLNRYCGRKPEIEPFGTNTYKSCMSNWGVEVFMGATINCAELFTITWWNHDEVWLSACNRSDTERCKKYMQELQLYFVQLTIHNEPNNVQDVYNTINLNFTLYMNSTFGLLTPIWILQTLHKNTHFQVSAGLQFHRGIMSKLLTSILHLYHIIRNFNWIQTKSIMWDNGSLFSENQLAFIRPLNSIFLKQGGQFFVWRITHSST